MLLLPFMRVGKQRHRAVTQYLQLYKLPGGDRAGCEPRQFDLSLNWTTMLYWLSSKTKGLLWVNPWGNGGWERWNHSKSIGVGAQGEWHSGFASHWSEPGGRNLCFISQLEIRLKCAFPWEKPKSKVNTTEVEWFERLESFWRTGLNRAWKGTRFLNQGHCWSWNAIGPKS